MATTLGLSRTNENDTGNGIGNRNGGGTSNGAKRPRGYECSSCGRLFKRSEHCIRHERGHTNSKPFPCDFCGRKYARKDLVTRHVQSFHPNGHVERKMNSTTKQVPAASPKSSSGSTPPQPHRSEGEGDSIVVDSVGSEAEIPQELHSAQGMNVIAPAITSQNSFPLSENNQFVVPGQNSVQSTEPLRGIEMSDIGQSLSYERVGSVSAMPLDTQPQHVSVQVPAHPHMDRRYSSANGTRPSLIQNETPWQADNAFENRSYDPPDKSVTTSGPAADSAYSYREPPDLGFYSLLSYGNTRLDVDLSILNSQLDYDSNGVALPWEDMESSSMEMFLLEDNPMPVPVESVNPAQNTVLSAGDAEKVRQNFINEDMRRRLQQDLEERLPPGMTLKLPSTGALLHFWKCFLSGFNNNYPILHLPSLFSKPIYSPLVLAILAIGALFHLKRTTAMELYMYSQTLLKQDCKTEHSAGPLSTETIHAKLYLTIFAVFSGKTEEITTCTEHVGFWAREYRTRREDLESRSVDKDNLTWAQWSEFESQKRLLCGIYILSSMLTITYDIVPFLSVTQDLILDIPDAEQKWQATSAQQWEQTSASPAYGSLPVIRDILCDLMFDNSKLILLKADQEISWSGFAITVIMHAVNVQMWHIMQCTQSFTGFPIEQATLGHSMVQQIEEALSRCSKLLENRRKDQDHLADSVKSPGFFNSQAVLRSAYVRVFTGARSFDRMTLMSENSAQIARRIQAYIQTPQRRTALLTKAVSMAYLGLQTPISAGFLLVKRTAALTWSVEHAIAAWDCALFVTKWIHGMETQHTIPIGPLDPSEAENLANFRSLLSEVDDEYEESGSLAADVANVWAQSLDDTWVWGITPQMSNLLRLLSKGYADDRKSKLYLG